MKLLISGLFLLIAFSASAQNWQPFTATETFCYKSDTSDVIDVAYRVDSITISGEDTFYNFNTIIEPIVDNIYEKYGAQFWKKHMRHAGGGLYYFTDPVSMALQTLGNVGDTWVFNYDDDAIATIIAADTMTILGELDSVKFIQTSSGYDITLSKNHGLISFPIADGPDPINCTLTGIRGRNLGEYLLGFKEYFDIHEGDVFQYRYDYSFFKWDSRTKWMKYTVTAADVTDTLAVFSMEGLQIDYVYDGVTTTEYSTTIADEIEIRPEQHSYTTKLPGGYAPFVLEFPYYWIHGYGDYDLFPAWGTDSLGNKTIEDAYCEDGTYFAGVLVQVSPEEIEFYDEFYSFANYCVGYTEGLGVTQVKFLDIEAWGSLNLTAYVKDGDTVGELMPDSMFIAAIQNYQVANINVYPNPATENIYATIPSASNSDLHLHLISMTGVAIDVPFTLNNNHLTIDIQSLPEGYYFISAVDNQNRYLSKPFFKSGDMP